MAATECGHGHIYDSDLYPSCPYCSNVQPIVNFGGPVVGTGQAAAYSEDRTAPLNGYGSAGTVHGSAAEYGTVMEDENVTQPPREYVREKRADEDQPTIGGQEQELGLEPVVGWLVCIEGKDKGKSYELWGRINTIGRSERMDVCIKGDRSISKENHARLGYDPKNNRFRLIPAASINNIYLNDDVVDVPTRLKAYDVMEFGSTKLVFIPFCSPRFSWEKGLMTPEGEENT